MGASLVKDRWLWLSLLAGGLILSFTLWFNLTMDQSIHCYGAWVWKHYRLPPYLGAWDQNFPGIFIIHRVVLELFGESEVGFRLFDFTAQFSCLAMIYYLTKTLSGLRGGGFWAAICYSIFYYGLGSREAGDRETFIIWLLLICLVVSFALEKRVWLKAILVGMLLGFIFLVKPFYGLCWPVFGILFLVQGFRERPKRIWLELSLFSLGCLVPSLLIIAYYWARGDLRELYRATLWYNFVIYSSWSEAPVNWLRLLWYVPFYSVMQEISIFIAGLVGLYPALTMSRAAGQRRLCWTILALALVAALAYLLQGKFLDYQLAVFWGFWIIPVAVGIAWIGSGVDKIARGIPGRILRPVFYLAVLAVLVKTSVGDDLVKFAWRYSFRSFDYAHLDVQGTRLDTHAASSFILAARYLERNLRPGDEVEFFGPFPLLSYLLKKKLPSRFCCVHHLLFLSRGGKRPELMQAWIEEYQNDVIKARPRYFVICDEMIIGPTNFNFNFPAFGFKAALRNDFPRLKDFVVRNYRPDSIFGPMEIYQWAGND